MMRISLPLAVLAGRVRPPAAEADRSGFEALHAWFLDRLVPVCAQLLDAAVNAGEIRPGTHAYELMRGIGNLCIGRDSDPRYDPRRLDELLLAGLQRPRTCAHLRARRDRQGAPVGNVGRSGYRSR